MEDLIINKSFATEPDPDPDPPLNNTKLMKKNPNIINRQEAHRLFKQYRRFETLCGIFSIITIISMIIDYEESYNVNSLEDACDLSKSKSENYRIVVVASSASSIYMLLCKYLTESKWYLKIVKVNPKLSISKDQIRTRRWNLALEAFILVICPIPYYDADIKIPQHFMGENISLCYRLGTVLFCLGMMRVYFIIRILINYSVFHNENAQIHCIKNNVETGLWFAVKALSNTHPFKMIGVFAFFTVLLGTVLSRILERPMDVHVNVFYDYIINYFWFIFQTITTIGYGEYTCITYGCRTIAVLTWFFGSICVGLLLSSLQNKVDLSKREIKAFTLITKDKGAAILLSVFLRYSKLLKSKHSKAELSSAKQSLHEAAERFHCLRLASKSECGKYSEVRADLFMIKLISRQSIRKLDTLITSFK